MSSVKLAIMQTVSLIIQIFMYFIALSFHSRLRDIAHRSLDLFRGLLRKNGASRKTIHGST